MWDVHQWSLLENIKRRPCGSEDVLIPDIQIKTHGCHHFVKTMELSQKVIKPTLGSIMIYHRFLEQSLWKTWGPSGKLEEGKKLKNGPINKPQICSRHLSKLGVAQMTWVVPGISSRFHGILINTCLCLHSRWCAVVLKALQIILHSPRIWK